MTDVLVSPELRRVFYLHCIEMEDALTASCHDRHVISENIVDLIFHAYGVVFRERSVTK